MSAERDIRLALRGHSIVDILIHESKEKFALIVGGSDYLVSVMLFEAEGDCCSQSWIEHVGNPDACRMARFEDWVDRDIEPNVDTLSIEEKRDYDGGELKFYYYTILTDKGETTIEMRNSSNGYYGGTLYYRGMQPFLDWNPEGFRTARE